MKTRIFLIYIILWALNTSCFVTKYTHYQVMDMAILNKSEDEILNNLGIPYEKRTEGSYEEWFYYDLGRRAINIGIPSASDSVTNITVRPLNFLKGDGASMMTNDYLKVTFQNGRATSWTAKGINYTVKEFSPVATIAACFLVAGVAVVAIGITVFYVYMTGFE